MLQDGQGPLHVAADLGNTKVVRTLMQLGADKDSRDKVRQSLCSPWSLSLLWQAIWCMALSPSASSCMLLWQL